jgi:hypothetical protein
MNDHDAAAAEDGRQRKDRRSGQDRRSGRDRRGSGERQPPSAEPRAYGFREFSDRRSPQDRRLYGSDGRPWDRRRSARIDDDADDLAAVLTKDEIRFLFAQSRRR